MKDQLPDLSALASAPKLGNGADGASSAPAVLAEVPPINACEPPRHAFVLPLALLLQEHEIRTEFLSEDLGRICAVAGKFCLPVLISTAGLPIEKRLEAFESWRNQAIGDSGAAIPEFSEMLRENSELREKLYSGLLSLADADGFLKSWIVNNVNEASRIRLEKKADLKNAVLKNVVDSDTGFGNRMPGWLVITSGGEMKAFHARSRARAYGAETGQPFYLFPVDETKVMIYGAG